MAKNPYPLVSAEFIFDKIRNSQKIVVGSELKIGSTTTFVLEGTKPINKRTITIREFNGEVGFMQATGLAILYGFMGDLLVWYRENKNWNEGGYSAK
jgi:hypothetical protein